MIDSLDLRFSDTAATFYYDAPEGRPSSVTSVDVFLDLEDDTATAQFSPTGTVETNPNTTLDATAGVDSLQTDLTKIPLTATTGIVRGRRYLLTAASGAIEWPEIERIVSADAVYARSPLLNTYASADTFQSTRMSATVDATWVADTNKLSQPMGYELAGGYVPSGVQPRYRARWIYVVSGTSYTAYTFLDLVRQPFRHSVLPPDVDAFSAGFFDRLGPDDRRNQGERVITEAARQVKEDLRTRGIVDWGQRNSDFLNGLVVRKAVYVGAAAAFQNGAVDDRWMTFADKTYQSYLDRTLAVSTTQATAGGAATETPDASLWTR